MNTFQQRLGFCVTLVVVAVCPSVSNAQSQQEMNQQAAKDFDQADKVLNKVYQQLMARLDEKSQAKLKAVQRAWVMFRDAQADFQADAEARGGSLAPLIYNGTRATMTKARITELEKLMKEYAK